MEFIPVKAEQKEKYSDKCNGKHSQKDCLENNCEEKVWGLNCIVNHDAKEKNGSDVQDKPKARFVNFELVYLSSEVSSVVDVELNVANVEIPFAENDVEHHQVFN